jgi:6-phosphogluconolactonase
MRQFMLAVFLFISLSCFSQQYYLFTGTYTNGKSKGIYIYRFNLSKGTVSPVSITENVENPSYLAIHPNGKTVYAVNENGGAKPGELSSFSFDQKTGKLKFLNKQPTGGDHPCYVSIDKTGKWAAVANYSGGNLAVFPINSDGSLAPHAQLIQHEGRGADPKRQEKAHVHSTVFSPDNKFLMVQDLGLDKIVVYKFDATKKEPLTHDSTLDTKVDAGSGPRHLAFHPTRPFAYVIEELSGTVRAFSVSGGKLTAIQSLSSHPPGFNGQKGSADIHVSPDGGFLYASNRGSSNTIAIYKIHDENGTLSTIGFQSTMGVHPRNFMMDPVGRYLLVANRDSNNIVIFKRDMQKGTLYAAGAPVEVPNPVFLGMLKYK